MLPSKKKLPAVRVFSAEQASNHTTSGLQDIWAHRLLLWAFVRRELKHRYTGSSLGVFWTVLTPLLELLTYTFVFHGLIGVNFSPTGGWANYALFLFCGMLSWLTLSDALSHSTSSLTNHNHLIKKVQFPAILLPTHLVISSTFNQGFRFLILAFAAMLIGDGLSWHIVLLPIVIVLQLVMTLGLGFLLATAQVYFRDTHHWVNALLMMWMFITPIFYPASSYPKQYVLFLQLNPLAHLVGIYRELILNHTLPHPNSILIVGVVSMLLFIIGQSVFHHHRDRLADWV